MLPLASRAIAFSLTVANVCNREWVSASENMSHAHSNGLRPKINTQGEKNRFSKLTEFRVRQIK
ncbi:MAG: hypothetical protein AAGE84_14080 [Cyanobacteria bacterium P01_G01_bin.39]